MVQQGGLGRGLSSLIPQRKQAKISQPKARKHNTKKVLKRSSIKSNSVGEANYFGGNYAKKEELIKNRRTITKNPRQGGKSFVVKKTLVQDKNKKEDFIDKANKQARESVMTVGVEEIVPNPYQPRTNFDKGRLQELSDSIVSHGIIQPLVVSRRKDGDYELIAGERRLEASKLAGLLKVPVVVREVTNQNKAEWALIENIQRHNLNPIEEAQAYERIKQEFDLTQDEVAQKVGKSRSAVANILRLLKLPQEIQDALVIGKITEGHARTILVLKDEKKQLDLFRSILKEGLNVRQVEGVTKGVKVSKNYRLKKDVDPDLLDIENKIADNLNTKVKIRGIKNNGKILIDYYSEEELGQIVEKLRGE